MKIAIGLILTALLFDPARSAAAQPCQLDLLEDLKEVHVDVPSARHPSYWHEGKIDGLLFRQFPEGGGILSSSKRDTSWHIELSCDAAGNKCDFINKGEVSVHAIEVAQRLKACAVRDIRPVIAEGQETELTGLIKTTEPETAVSQPICETPPKYEDNLVLSLQALLVASGASISIDGIMGPKTRSALTAMIGTGANKLQLADAIDRMETVLCEGTVAQSLITKDAQS